MTHETFAVRLHITRVGHLTVLVLVALILLLSDTKAFAQFAVSQFSPWQGYAIPNGVWLTGDFNGDGSKDIFHAVANSNYAHVWLSSGGRNFDVRTFSPWAGYAIPNGIWLAADMNGDGKTDIIHAVANTDYAHIWISNGDGTFVVKTFRPWGGYGIPNGLWMTGDFNGDGNADIFHAVANTDYVHVWLSNGDGTFQVATFRPWAGYAIPNGVWLVADIDGDGKSDVVHAVANTDYAHVWRSNGNGTFTVGTFRPWAGYAIPNGLWMTGDFNGDGKADLLHAVANTDYVHVWTSNGNGTFTVGTFRPWQGYAIPNGLWLTGDFDNDGKTDIVHAVQNTNYVHIWRSVGNASFVVSTFSPWAGYAIPNGLWLPADFDGDGRTDIVHAVQNTDYVHPWISTMPTPRQVSLDGLEITQSVQDITHTVALISAKTTEARAYLSTISPTPITIRGVLTASRPGMANVTINSTNVVAVNPAQNGQIRPKREAVAQSLNFVMPNSLVITGVALKLQLTKVTLSAGGANVICSDCAVEPVTVSFTSAAPMRLRVIGLRYTQGTPPVTFQPGALDFNLTNSWLRRAYPISQLNMTSTTVNSNTAPPFSCGDANALVAGIRNLDVSGGTDARTHYFGLVSDGGFFMRGCAAIPSVADPTAIGSGPTGSNTWGWDTDGSYGDWYSGHELGHTYGRFHPGSGCGETADDPSYPFPNGQISDNTGRFVGFDVGDGGQGIGMAALPGVVWHDVMTYCPSEWLSSYTYEGIRARLTAENALAPGARQPGSSAPGSPRISTAEAVQATSSMEIHGVKLPPLRYARPQPPKPIIGARRPPMPTLGLSEEPRQYEAATKKPEVPEPYAKEPELPRPLLEGPPPILYGYQEIQRGLPAQKEKLDFEVRTGDFMNVVATVNLTRNTAQLRPIHRVNRAMVPTVVSDSRAVIRLLDNNSRELASYPVLLKQNTDRAADEDQTALIDASVPWIAATKQVDVLLSGKVVASRRASRNAPTVRAVRAAFAQAKGEVAPLEISWDASDPDGDKLTFSVQLSQDLGRTWETVALDQPISSLQVGTASIKNVRTLKIRVIANDGFYSSTGVGYP